MARGRVVTISKDDLQGYNLPDGVELRSNPGVTALMSVSNGRGAYRKQVRANLKLTGGKVGGLKLHKTPPAKHRRKGAVRPEHYAGPGYRYPVRTTRRPNESVEHWHERDRKLVRRALSYFGQHKNRYSPQVQKIIACNIAKAAKSVGQDSPKAMEYRTSCQTDVSKNGGEMSLYFRRVARPKRKPRLRRNEGLPRYDHQAFSGRMPSKTATHRMVYGQVDEPATSRMPRKTATPRKTTTQRIVYGQVPTGTKRAWPPKDERFGPTGTKRIPKSSSKRAASKRAASARAAAAPTGTKMASKRKTAKKAKAAPKRARWTASRREEQRKIMKARWAAKKTGKAPSKRAPSKRAGKSGTQKPKRAAWTASRRKRHSDTMKKVWAKKLGKKPSKRTTAAKKPSKRTTAAKKPSKRKTSKRRKKAGFAGAADMPGFGMTANRRRRSGRRYVRRNASAGRMLTAMVQPVLVGAGGYAVHRIGTSSLSALLSGIVSPTVAKLVSALAVAVGGGYLVNKFLPKYAFNASIGMGLSTFGLAVKQLLPDFANYAGFGDIQSASLLPRYSVGQYYQAASGDPFLQAAAGDPFLQAAAGEYFTQPQLGEYFSQDIFQVPGSEGNFAMSKIDVKGDTGAYEFHQAFEGVNTSPIDEGISPNSNMDAAFNFMEAAAGVGTAQGAAPRSDYIPQERALPAGSRSTGYEEGIFDQGGIFAG